MWIDTHCHLDAAEFDADRANVIARAQVAGVRMIVVPGVTVAGFDGVREAALACGGAYALGVHPLYVADLPFEDAMAQLTDQLERHREDPRLVAIGEIGLDFFVPDGQTVAGRALQERFYLAQLKLAVRCDLPVILHVRRSADALLAGLRRLAREGTPVRGGIAHAFNGSEQQAQAFVALGFKLGFGGAMTYERALQIRRLAASLPDEAWVLETDAPDIPPAWRHAPPAVREAWRPEQGPPPWRNEPADLADVARCMASLRGLSLSDLHHQQHANALAALPGLAAWVAAR